VRACGFFGTAAALIFLAAVAGSKLRSMRFGSEPGIGAPAFVTATSEKWLRCGLVSAGPVEEFAKPSIGM
jgi:hypothetical protein